MSAEILTTPTTTDNNLSPSIKEHGKGNSVFCLVLKGSYLKQKKHNLYSVVCFATT